MSKRAKPAPTSSRDPKATAPSPAAELACEPFKPLPGLFKILLIGFALWLGVLLTLYFRTVYPLRHPSTDAATTRPGASALPSAPR